jgi:hypothetical protein
MKKAATCAASFMSIAGKFVLDKPLRALCRHRAASQVLSGLSLESNQATEEVEELHHRNSNNVGERTITGRVG